MSSGSCGSRGALRRLYRQFGQGHAEVIPGTRGEGGIQAVLELGQGEPACRVMRGEQVGDLSPGGVADPKLAGGKVIGIEAS